MGRSGDSQRSEKAAPGEKLSQVARQQSLLTESLRSFFHRFVGYVKARKLYPEGHQRTAKQLEAWYDQTLRSLKDAGEITIFVRTQQMELCEIPFGSKEKVVFDFIPEFVRRHIRFVAIKRGIDPEELLIFAELFLVDAEEVVSQGGVAKLLQERLTERLFVVEYSDEAKELLRTQAAVRAIRRLVEMDGDAASAEQKIKELLRERVQREELERLDTLFSQREVAERLNALQEELGATSKLTGGKLKASHLALEIVRRLYEAKDRGSGPQVTDEIQAVAFLLDKMRCRLNEIASNPTTALHQRILREISRRWTSRKGSLMECLAVDPADPEASFAEAPSDLVKTVFRQIQREGKGVKIGHVHLECASSSGLPQDAGAAPRKGRGEREKEKDIASLEARLREFRASLRKKQYELNFDAVPEAHFDVLLEILRRDTGAALRQRALVRLRSSIRRYIETASGQERVFLGRRILGEAGTLGEAELQELLKDSLFLRQAIWEFLQGQTAWSEALREQARRDRTKFADIFVDEALQTKWQIPEEGVRGFVADMEEHFLQVLKRRIGPEDRNVPLRRCALLLSQLRSVEALPLIERILPRVGTRSRERLVGTLVEIDPARAVGVVSLAVQNTRGLLAKAFVKHLGEIEHPLGEEALLDLARRRRKLSDEELSLRLAVLEALKKRGGERALKSLVRFGQSWRFLLTSRRRQYRRALRETAGAIRRRLSEEKEPTNVGCAH